MNWDQIEGKWKGFTGSARERWGKLTDNDWKTMGGKKDQLAGRIQERYGVAKAEAEKQADECARALSNPSAKATLPLAFSNHPSGIRNVDRMKPTQARIADFWCRLMHAKPMWPSHGQYECRTCGRRHRVCWEEPSPATPRVMVLPYEARAQGLR